MIFLDISVYTWHVKEQYIYDLHLQQHVIYVSANMIFEREGMIFIFYL